MGKSEPDKLAEERSASSQQRTEPQNGRMTFPSSTPDSAEPNDLPSSLEERVRERTSAFRFDALNGDDATERPQAREEGGREITGRFARTRSLPETTGRDGLLSLPTEQPERQRLQSGRRRLLLAGAGTLGSLVLFGVWLAALLAGHHAPEAGTAKRGTAPAVPVPSAAPSISRPTPAITVAAPAPDTRPHAAPRLAERPRRRPREESEERFRRDTSPREPLREQPRERRETAEPHPRPKRGGPSLPEHRDPAFDRGIDDILRSLP